MPQTAEEMLASFSGDDGGQTAEEMLAANTRVPGSKPKPVARPATPAPKKPKVSLGDSLVENFGGNLVKTYKRLEGARRKELVSDFTKPIERGPTPFATLPAIGRAGKTALDALAWASSPVSAAAESIIGRPVETATGGRIKKETAGVVAEAAAPFAGAARAVTQAGRAAIAAEDFLKTTRSTRAAIDTGRLGSAKPPVGQGTVQQAQQAVDDSVRAFKTIFAPTTVNETSAKAGRIHRRNLGETGLMADRAVNDLMQHSRDVAKLPVEEQRALVNYIETRSAGGKLPAAPAAAPKAPRGLGIPKPPADAVVADSRFQKAADTVADVYGRYRKEIEDTLGDDGPTFIRDYYTHLWKNPAEEVEQAMAPLFAKQGTGKNLKARSIPTIQEGIERGLTPVTENPLEATGIYAQNMSRYLATNRILKDMDAEGMSRFYAPGQQPTGWVPLDGILARKQGKTIIKDGDVVGSSGEQLRYAPPEVATVYNNYISKGFEHGSLAPFYKPARAVANNMNALKLGLSGFHAFTIATDSIISDVARAFGGLSRLPGVLAKEGVAGAKRELGTTGKALASAPVAPVTTYLKGRDFRKAALAGGNTGDPVMDKVVSSFARSGQRLGMDNIYRARESGSFFNALEHGTLKKEVEQAWDQMYKGTAWENAKGAVDNVMNVIQSTAAPLFEKYIPTVKSGAFYSRMSDYIRGHPDATQEQIDKFAVALGDSIDNRFGEMLWDNIFWDRKAKEISQMILLSPSWNMGTVSEIGGGILNAPRSLKGLATGEGLDRKTEYVLALAAVTALTNGAATYLKTGEMPEGMDFAVYRTGGVDAASGEPERALMPGNQKDVYATAHDFPHHIPQEIVNKLHPALKTAIELSTNKDFRGLPIYRPKGVEPIEGEPGIGEYLVGAFTPISIADAIKGRKVGSNISTAERVMAIRPAPAYMTAPERQKQFKKSTGTREWKRRIKADARAESRLEKNQEPAREMTAEELLQSLEQ